MQPFDRLESEVRSYCRSFPVVFTHAEGAVVRDEDGQEYLDFFAGAGALNYGHNHPVLREALVDYLQSGAVTHMLDMHTAAKRDLLLRFEEVILKPRGLDMKLLFPGPTGTNAVETALKIARKKTGRDTIVGFTNGYHGMTLGALAITGNESKRRGGGVTLPSNRVMPFDGYFGDEVDTIDMIRRMIQDGSSGVDAPAAFVLETVQAEGGVRVASQAWLQGLRELADDVGALLILDDIQVGCGRTGPFFSFDGMNLDPDIITLSKSLSGYGLPFALCLVKPEHDVFTPGEHNGTFRGFNPAMVTAAKALDFWEDDAMVGQTTAKGAVVRQRLQALADAHGGEVRGRGLIQAIEFSDPAAADAVAKACFERHLIIETAGAKGEVLKVLPPLLIPEEQLLEGLDRLDAAVEAVLGPVVRPAAAMSAAEVNA